MVDPALHALLTRAQAARDSGHWSEAVRLFRQAEQHAPAMAEIKHNLAMASFAAGDAAVAKGAAEQAIALAPGLWQSHALLARIYRAAGEAGACEQAWQQLLRHSPGNGAALLGLADLSMNEFGDAAAAVALARTVAGDRTYEGDALLTELMGTLYLGDGGDAALSARLRSYAQNHLRSPRRSSRPPRGERRRVGAISPLFSASPVYYLCWSTLATVAARHDLVLIDRGSRRDWATERLRGIAHEWIDAAHVEVRALAELIAGAELDILFDLGGWADAAALVGVSGGGMRMFKWVGGQSATTGIEAFSGWIGDVWQSPAAFQPLYAEPIVNIPGGYVDYTPPPGFERHRDAPKSGVAIVGNPVKIVPRLFEAWPRGVERVTLIDRRYAHERVRERVTELLARGGVTVEQIIVPGDYKSYLEAVSRCEAIVNTAPYAAGLTAVEALQLGVRVLTGPSLGGIFAWRHHLSHLRTGGRNPRLPAEILRLIEA